jgi:hypothetical protein
MLKHYRLKLKPGAFVDYGDGRKRKLPEEVSAEMGSDGQWILISICHEVIPAEFVLSAKPLPKELWMIG